MPTSEVRPEDGDALQTIANALVKARKVVVVTGAGISTNSGIPVRVFCKIYVFEELLLTWPGLPLREWAVPAYPGAVRSSSEGSRASGSSRAQAGG